MTVSMSERPTWVVDVGKQQQRDASTQLVELAVSHAVSADVNLLLVHVLTEVPTSRKVEIPSSEVDKRAAFEYAKKLYEILLKPLMSIAGSSEVLCTGIIELNDVVEDGLCMAIKRCNATRLYISARKKMLGWSLPTAFADCQARLPPSCTIIAGYKKKEVQRVTGSGRFMTGATLAAAEPFYAPAVLTTTGTARSSTVTSSQRQADPPPQVQEPRPPPPGRKGASLPAKVKHFRSSSSDDTSASSESHRQILSLSPLNRPEHSRDASSSSLPYVHTASSSPSSSGSQQSPRDVSQVVRSSSGGQLNRYDREVSTAARGSSPETAHTRNSPTRVGGIRKDNSRSRFSNETLTALKEDANEGTDEVEVSVGGVRAVQVGFSLADELAELEGEDGGSSQGWQRRAVASNRAQQEEVDFAVNAKSEMFPTNIPEVFNVSGPQPMAPIGHATTPPGTHTPSPPTSTPSSVPTTPPGPMAERPSFPTSRSIRNSTSSNHSSSNMDAPPPSQSSRFQSSRFTGLASFSQAQQGGGFSQSGVSQGSVGRAAFSSGQLSPRSAALMGTDVLECRQFSSGQISRATGSYNAKNLLGRGSFGQVFKGEMLGCKVAIKKLEGSGWQGPDEFRMEVEVLSRMRHPNIVLLMGCCIEEMALVYEYLPGGTLQDKLGTRKSSMPLSWADRMRIVSEVSSALLYLHQNEPPIVHRDLKPDNILLDAHSISKVGDVGLARLLVGEDDSMTMKVRGTAGYIDPEEVETCEVSVLSDIYAFGLITLQLLTGQKNVRPVHRMVSECMAASMGGKGEAAGVSVVMKYLDNTGGEWRLDLAQKVAAVALRCVQRRRSDRPDLASEVHPMLAEVAAQAAEEVKERKKELDAQFICPISKELMRDPVVAGDGFTYEREAITRWMESCSLSPATGMPLPHLSLTPNLVLRKLIEGSSYPM